jgi:hypothetical protein
MAQERERETGGDAPGPGGEDDGDTTASDAPRTDESDAEGTDRRDDPATGEREDAHDDDGDDRPPVVERDAVANAFVDAAPRTIAEIAEATGLNHDTTERRLEELVDDGELASKTLQTSGATVRVWYQPATAHVERLASGSPDDDRTDALDDAIEDLDVPGVSDMMQNWRRDAIRGAWEYLVEHGAATDAAVIDAVYPGHSAGYDDRDAWWECVRPRLTTLPGVTPPSDGTDDVWTYRPA